MNKSLAWRAFMFIGGVQLIKIGVMLIIDAVEPTVRLKRVGPEREPVKHYELVSEEEAEEEGSEEGDDD